MTQIAKMRFVSLAKPEEQGTLVLHDDGTLQVVPSDELRDEMSRLEEVALRRAQFFGTGLGLTLVALGALAVGAGWLFGRVFGRLGYTLSRPRPVNAVTLTRTEGGGVHLKMHGASRLHIIRLAWSAEEVLQAEADAFLAKYNEVQTTAGKRHS